MLVVTLFASVQSVSPQRLRRWMRSLPLCCALLFALVSGGCGGHPPSVKTAWAVRQLPSGTVSIGARGLPDDVVPELARLPHLQMIFFGRGHLAIPEARITDVGLEHLADLDLPELETLSLFYCDGITDRGLEHISRISGLESVMLGDCPGITDEGLRWIAKLKHLEYLDLRDSPQITDAGLRYLAEAPALNNLNLTGCTGVSDVGVLAVAKARSKLHLSLVECTGVSDAAVKELRRLLPGSDVRGPGDSRMSPRRNGEL